MIGAATHASASEMRRFFGPDQVVELLAKLRRELNENQTINVLITAEWHHIRAIVLDALSAYPHARVAVAEALQRISHGHGA